MSPSIFDLFHRRIQESKGKIPNTYSYIITESFKKRFIMMFHEICEISAYPYISIDKTDIIKHLRMAFGVFSLDELSKKTTFNPFDEIQLFILNCNDNDKIISSIEYICRFFLEKCRTGQRRCYIAIKATNEYFRYDRIGYKFIDEGEGFIVPIEDEVFSNECTQQSLSLLAKKGYGEAQNFFIDAYKKLAISDYDDALVDVGRAIETLLKERFSKLGIPYDDKKDSLNKLLNIAKQHIITPYSFEPFQQTLLEVGRARNQMGAHGVTPGQTPVADELHVRFAINQAAANLLFLAEVPMSN